MHLFVAILFLVILIIAIIIIEPENKTRKQNSVSLSEFDRFIDQHNNIPETTKAGIKLDARKFGFKKLDWIDTYFPDIPLRVRRGLKFFLS